MSTPLHSVYVHVPFCHTLCGYCDFYSVVLDRQAVSPLVEALLAEWGQARREHDIQADTIFVGGGTPTTLPPKTLRRLLAALSEVAGKQTEFTVEANPATVTPEIAAALVESGVNRVSIGAQSFDPVELRVLERIHKPQQVAQTLRTCRAAGIKNCNLDLIFAVPGQSLEAWLANLRRAIDLGPNHLSCYALTFEPGTRLFEQRQAGSVHPADIDLEADMYEATIDTLAAAGYAQYEISNFARAGAICRHNVAIWRNQPYIGIGPSAAGYIGGVRYRNVADHVKYVAAIAAGRSAWGEHERRTPGEAARDTMMMGLRLIEGVDRQHFREQFGTDPTEMFAEQVEHFAGLGLLEITDTAIRLTRRGLMVGDTVMMAFV